MDNKKTIFISQICCHYIVVRIRGFIGDSETETVFSAAAAAVEAVNYQARFRAFVEVMYSSLSP